MYRKILVGTDGTPTAAHAVEHAAQLAELSGATLHVVCARKSPPVFAGAGELVAASLDAEAASAEATKAILEEVLVQLDGRPIRVEAHDPMGDPGSCLVDLAAALKADVIVVGSKGMHGGRRLLGSVPNTVTHRAACHVLVVHTA